MLVTVLGLLASGIFLIRLLPQPIRLARSGVAAGVSPVAALNAVTSAVAWTAYGLLQHDPVIWVVSLLALVPCTWQAALLARQTTRRDIATAAAVAGAIVAAGLAGVLGLVLAATVLLTAGPQVRLALSATDLSGIAPQTWRVALLDAATWGAYGWAVADPALIGYFGVLTASAATILVRIAWCERLASAEAGDSGGLALS